MESMLAETLAGLPPAIVITAEFDPLRDEGKAYGERLKLANVPCRMIHFDDLPHGFVTSYQVSPASNAALSLIATALRELATAG